MYKTNLHKLQQGSENKFTEMKHYRKANSFKRSPHAMIAVMFHRFNQRSLRLERLDTGDYTLEEYAKWQDEIKLINRLLGDVRALRHSLIVDIEKEGKEKFSVLDVGAGSGELLQTIGNWSCAKKKRARLVGLELNEQAAKSIQKNTSNVLAVQGDALRLPFADDSFDYAISSLFTHHLKDGQVVSVLKEMSRVARARIFVIDLHRHPLAYHLYRTFGKLFLQKFTLEDGSLSILRSFRPNELKRLAEKANLEDVKVERRLAFRLVLSGRKGVDGKA
jgi:ubiquinone/menaquinone biosynthesis C-methylase UbiE